MTQTTKAELLESPDVRQEMTVAEARALPGLLGRIAGAMLQAKGHYGYINSETGQTVLIVRKDA